ncbi:MAG: DUF427 domain-containing protein [Pseudomonadota bacterium]
MTQTNEAKEANAGSPVTFVKDRIENPAEPRHYMKLKPTRGPVTLKLGERVLAHSEGAFRLLEVGYDLYDPVLYVPWTDVSASLARIEAKTTHCPLKGDASYWALEDAAHSEAIAWSYETPFDFAAVLAGHVAFDPSKITVIEGPSA